MAGSKLRRAVVAGVVSTGLLDITKIGTQDAMDLARLQAGDEPSLVGGYV